MRKTKANRSTDLVGGERVEGMVKDGRLWGIGLVDDCGGGKQCGWGHIVGYEADRPLEGRIWEFDPPLYSPRPNLRTITPVHFAAPERLISNMA